MANPRDGGGLDEAALARLYVKLEKPIFNVVYRWVWNASDAREITQEAFLRVYRNLHSFRFDCSFHTWLYRIATNLCLDQLRKRKVRKEEPVIVTTADGTLDRAETAAETRVEGDPLRNLFSGQIRKHVKEALGELTPRERMVFELRHYEGMRLRKIGEVLGTSEEAAKNCLFRATQKMRLALGELV